MSDLNDKPAAIALLLAKDEVYLVLTNDKPYNIRSWDNVVQAANYFTGGYMANHQRGYEASMSATLHFIFFQPRVMMVQTIRELQDLLLPKVDPKELRVTTLRHVSGWFQTIKCKPEARAIYDKAIVPALMVPSPV